MYWREKANKGDRKKDSMGKTLGDGQERTMECSGWDEKEEEGGDVV